MVNNITFVHSDTKGCWVSDKITKAGMAYIQVERKGPGYLRVYTNASGQSPVLAHVAQQANTAFCVCVLPDDVAITIESETEVTRASACGGTTGVALTAIACYSNINAGKMYDYELGSPCYVRDLDDNEHYYEPGLLLFTSGVLGKLEGICMGDEKMGVEEMVSEGALQEIDDEIVADFAGEGIDVGGYDYILTVAYLCGVENVTLLYDGKEYPLVYKSKDSGTSASTQQAAVGLKSASPLRALSARLAARKEVKA